MSKYRAKPAVKATGPKPIEFLLDDVDVQLVVLAFAEAQAAEAAAQRVLEAGRAKLDERLAPVLAKYKVPKGVKPNIALNEPGVPSAISWTEAG